MGRRSSGRHFRTPAALLVLIFATSAHAQTGADQTRSVRLEAMGDCGAVFAQGPLEAHANPAAVALGDRLEVGGIYGNRLPGGITYDQRGFAAGAARRGWGAAVSYAHYARAHIPDSYRQTENDAALILGVEVLRAAHLSAPASLGLGLSLHRYGASAEETSRPFAAGGKEEVDAIDLDLGIQGSSRVELAPARSGDELPSELRVTVGARARNLLQSKLDAGFLYAEQQRMLPTHAVGIGLAFAPRERRRGPRAGRSEARLAVEAAGLPSTGVSVSQLKGGLELTGAEIVFLRLGYIRETAATLTRTTHYVTYGAGLRAPGRHAAVRADWSHLEWHLGGDDTLKGDRFAVALVIPLSSAAS